MVWSLVTPLFMLAVYGVVLTQGAKVTGDGIPYLAFAWTGLVIWSFFSAAVNSGTQSMLSVSHVVTKIYFPREVVPLAAVVVALAEATAGAVLLLCLAVAQTGRTMLGIPLLAVIPALICLLAWACALAIFLSVAAVFVRDLVYAMTIIMQVGFFASPVMYPVSFLKSLRWVASVNPIAVVIESVRSVLLRGTWPKMELLSAHMVAGLICLALALWYSRSVEHRVADAI